MMSNGYPKKEKRSPQGRRRGRDERLRDCYCSANAKTRATTTDTHHEDALSALLEPSWATLLLTITGRDDSGTRCFLSNFMPTSSRHEQ
jgi:hypothetical protein